MSWVHVLLSVTQQATAELQRCDGRIRALIAQIAEKDAGLAQLKSELATQQAARVAAEV